MDLYWLSSASYVLRSSAALDVIAVRPLKLSGYAMTLDSLKYICLHEHKYEAIQSVEFPTTNTVTKH